MNSKKLFLIPIAVCILLVTACGKIQAPEFVNPGDILGGGGTGEIAGEVDISKSDSTKGDMEDKSNLDDLSKNVSSSGAIEVAATTDIVNISEEGTYLFNGQYGGIFIAKAGLKLHFIFDGVTINNTNGVAIDGTVNKKTELVITLVDNTTNVISNNGDDVNAIHIKGSVAINGKGTLNVTSESKSTLKASKEIQIVDAILNLRAKNHGITGASVIASDCTINVLSAGKDGINAECDDATAFTTEEGYVTLKNVNYMCDVLGDGIQADTIVYINGGTYDIKTTGNFVVKSATNMATYGMTADDFRYKKIGNDYQKVASDQKSGTLYGLTQGCKGIKVGEIEYTDENGNDIVVTDGDYLIVIIDGIFNIDSTDDAIHANSGNVLIEGGTYTISTYDDGITSDVLTKITGGSINITTCYEGIEGAYVEITGGTIDLVSIDDGINAASDDNRITEHIIISGGEITVNSSGDGLDSNGSILISGGRVIVYGPTGGGDAGMDADRGIVVTGGILLVTSTLGMVETPASNSTQYVVSYAHQSTITVGSTISLCDKDGNVLIAVTLTKNCQSIIISSPDIKKGETYYIYGGTTQITSFTVSSIITSIGSSGSSFPGGGGMRPGGR